MNLENMGTKIKECRLKRGITIAVCAERAGISNRYLADIERGDKTPRLETLLMILNVLEASADEVLQDSLVIGYKSKSNELLNKIKTLDAVQKKQALEIFDSVINVLKKNENPL